MRSRLLYILMPFAFGILLWSCGGAMMEDRAPENKSQAGWDNAMDSTSNGGFEFIPYEEQETGPGLVMMERDSQQKIVLLPDTDAMKQSVAQKLTDFYGYWEIIANAKYDAEMRKEARKAALEMVDDPNVNTIAFPGALKNNVSSVLQGYSLNTSDNVSIQIHDVSVEFLRDPGDSLVTRGVIRYGETFKTGEVRETGNVTEFFIRKQKKKFGGTEQEVNVVFLGNTIMNEK